jgi:very-short-patch-repair endonuclease
MRKVMTDAELKLWNELRALRLMGLGFRRQFRIAGYIADFACPEKKLVVDWTILRFWNDDVIRDIDNVCQHIVIEAGLAGVT